MVGKLMPDKQPDKPDAVPTEVISLIDLLRALLVNQEQIISKLSELATTVDNHNHIMHEDFQKIMTTLDKGINFKYIT